MPETIMRLPQLSDSVAEGTISRWLKQPGESIGKDEPLLEIETDKVTLEVPSPADGMLVQILQPEGTLVSVGEDLAVLGEVGALILPAPSVAIPEPVKTTTVPVVRSVPPVSPVEVNEVLAPPASPAPSVPIALAPHVALLEDAPAASISPLHPAGALRSPAVQRAAIARNLDLASITGSGLGGRVTLRDIERTLGQSGSTTTPEMPVAPLPANHGSVGLSVQPQAPEMVRAGPSIPQTSARVGDEDCALTPMRRAIAEHMTASRATIPDAWSVVRIDMTRLASLRARLRSEWQAREGHTLSYLPFAVHAVVAGLKAVPELNSTWHAGGSGYTVHKSCHVGIAVSIDAGLVVPVLRDADEYSLPGLARKLHMLIQQARSGKLAPDDLRGATFTVNNSGSLGSFLTQAVIPVGQAGIVTMEAIVKEPIVTEDDAIAIRSMMNSTLSFDHRILDGSQALKFLTVLRQRLEFAEFSW